MPSLPILSFLCFLSLLFHSTSLLAAAAAADSNILDAVVYNATDSNSSLQRSNKDESFADIIDRALEKEFPENNEQNEGVFGSQWPLYFFYYYSTFFN